MTISNMQTAGGRAPCILPCLFSLFYLPDFDALTCPHASRLFFCYGRFYWSLSSLVPVAVGFCSATGEEGKYQRRSWGGEREDGVMAGITKDRVGRENEMDGSWDESKDVRTAAKLDVQQGLLKHEIKIDDL